MDRFRPQKSKHLKGQLWPRVNDVFVYSCPAPLPGSVVTPRKWRFCVFLPCPPPRSVVTPRKWRFCLFLPCPPPRSVVTPRGSRFCFVFQGSFMVFHGFWLVSMVFQGSFMGFHGFWLFSMVFMVPGWFVMVPGWFFMVFLLNVPAPNCILARRSSLGPPPGGRHRT